MKDNAVCLIDLELLAVHHHVVILVIHTEKCHRVALMVQTYQMPVVRKQRCILGILAAHR